MLTREKLVNIALFLERVPVTGKEAVVWTETYTAVGMLINAMDEAAKKQALPKDVA